MRNKKLPFFIDLLFTLVLMPLLILLLPVERWFVQNPSFVLSLVLWFYAVYFVHRLFSIPLCFQSRKGAITALLILLASILVTYFFSRYQWHWHGPEFPWGNRPGARPFRIPGKTHIYRQAVWFLFVVVSSFSIAVGLLTELNRQAQARQTAEFRREKAELALYKAQINPHFLFNTLNTIYGLILTHSPKAEKAFLQFTQMMKYMYRHVTEDMVKVEDEIRYISQYVELQKNRLSRLTRVEFSYDGRNGDPEAVIPPLLLMPFVENVFKYGVSSHQESRIRISITLDGNRLMLHTSNPILQTNEENKTGIGISNTRKRLDLLYPERYSLDIEESPTRFTLDLSVFLNPTKSEKR